MIYDYDLEKDAANLEKHDVTLAFGRQVFDDFSLLIVPTIRQEDEEERYKAIGRVGQKLWTAVHVYRGERVRLISIRRSNAGERKAYNRHSG